MNRRDLIQAAEVGRRDLQSRTGSLFRDWAVNDRPRKASRMIVIYRDAGIGMVAFEMTMTGMILMSQTAFQCLRRYGINKEKRK